jgi:signal transduction histidine kinase
MGVLPPDGGVSKRYRRMLNDGWEIAIHIDASEESHREWALAEAKNQAEAANMVKNNFLKSVSYELRTPVNAILGFGKLLQRNNDNSFSEKQSNYIDGIKVSGERLLDLVGGILELSRVENGELAVRLVDFDCSEDMRNCLQDVQHRATVRGVKIVENSQLVERSIIKADKKLFNIVFNRLLINAIDFSPKGGQVGVSVEKLSDGFIRLKISDSGKGIYRDNNSNQLRYIGQELTGEVGVEANLYVCKHHIEQMNGRINFESTARSGSTIWIDMPIAASAEILQKEAPQGV